MKKEARYTIYGIIIFLAIAEIVIHDMKPAWLNKGAFNLKQTSIANYKEITDLQINPTSNYNYKTKEEIYAIRKNHVANSLFNYKKYTPSEEVFGNIEDGKPWYGLKWNGCINAVKGTLEVMEGNSEESRFINNPNHLIGIVCWGYDIDPKLNPESEHLCHDKENKTIARRTTYFPKENRIETEYVIRRKFFCDFVGINARDLGYKYAFASNVENVSIYGQENISDAVYEFKDYLHTGTNCGLETGCTNNSPHQKELDFSTSGTGVGRIDFKLWKEKPLIDTQRADINYTILISGK